ncbi:MAG: hypothetical protein VZR53_18100 [Prevotella sp.]|nr:hypothetical protein [Prevotella sp.]
MKFDFLPGTFAIIAGCMILYWAYSLFKSQKNKIIITFVVTIGIICIILGCLGIYNDGLEGVNLLIFGITMTIFMKNDKGPHGGPLWSWHIEGWLVAFLSILFGIIDILEDLHILE